MTDIKITLRQARNYIKNYYTANNKFPKLGDLEDSLGVNSYDLKKILALLQEENFIYRSGNRYLLTTDDENTEILSTETKIPKSNKSLRTYKPAKINQLTFSLLQYISFAVGIGTTAISIYFSNNWLSKYFEIDILSFVLAACIVLFSIICFELIIIFFGRHNGWMVFMFIIMWIVSLIISITSTIAGLYDGKIDIDSISNNVNASVELKDSFYQKYDNMIKELDNQIESNQNEINYLNDLLSQFDNLETRKKDWNFYITTKNQLVDCKNTADNLLSNKNNLIDKQMELMVISSDTNNQSIVQMDTFFQWIKKSLKFNFNIELVIYAMVGCFIDIIAPLSIATAMFLQRKSEFLNG